MLDGLGAVGGNAGDGLDVLQHTAHHLPGSLGDGLFLLCSTVRHPFRDGLHGLGHAIGEGGGAVGYGRDHGLGCVLDLLISTIETLSQTVANLHADLVKDFGRGVDAQPPLDPGDKAVDAVADPLGQAVPCALDTVQQAADDVLANMAPLVHAAVPHAHQLCYAGEGGLRQILKTADNTVHQRGQHSCTALEDVRQMGDQGSCPFGDQGSCRRDELGQVIGDADDEALQQLHTGVHDLVCMVAEIKHKLGNDLGGAGEQGGSGIDDALREGCQHLSTGVQHGRHRVGQVLGQLGDDLHAGGHQPGQLLGNACR